MSSLTANELKRGGVTVLEKAMNASDEHRVIIDVRGKPKFVVLDISEYNAYREYELDQAIAEAEADYISGRYDDFDRLAKELHEQ